MPGSPLVELLKPTLQGVSGAHSEVSASTIQNCTQSCCIGFWVCGHCFLTLWIAQQWDKSGNSLPELNLLWADHLERVYWKFTPLTEVHGAWLRWPAFSITAPTLWYFFLRMTCCNLVNRLFQHVFDPSSLIMGTYLGFYFCFAFVVIFSAVLH